MQSVTFFYGRWKEKKTGMLCPVGRSVGPGLDWKKGDWAVTAFVILFFLLMMFSVPFPHPNAPYSALVPSQHAAAVRADLLCFPFQTALRLGSFSFCMPKDSGGSSLLISPCPPPLQNHCRNSSPSVLTEGNILERNTGPGRVLPHPSRVGWV